jgi:hypothetical protein
VPTVDKQISLEVFSPCIGSTFRVAVGEDEYLELELIEATPLKATPGAPRQDPFTLLFRGPVDRYLPQRLYDLDGGTLGTFQLFLIPRMPDQEGSYFEAIIN